MGLPILAIPDTLMPQLATILRDAGIEVDELPISEQDDPAHFLMCLVCTMGNECVVLSIQRELHVTPDGVVIIIYPGRRSADKLIKYVSHALQEQGAWIPKGPQSKQPA